MTEALGYYVLLNCENCDEEIYDGVYVTLLEHMGLPVVAADHASQTRFNCPRCGASNYTGDLDVFVEGGADVDDDDDDKENDDDPGNT